MRAAVATGAEPVPTPAPRPRRPLIADAWRIPALATIAVCAVGFTVLAVAVHGLRRATGFDDDVLRWLFFHVGPNGTQISLDATNPLLIAIAVAFAAVGCLAWRRWDAAVLVVLAPAVSLALTEYVLKPMIGRRSGTNGVATGFDEISSYAFPSGHTAALSGLTLSLCLVVVRARVGRLTRTVAVVALLVWTVVGAAGLVRNYYHYATDTVGGALVSIACVLAGALVLDRVRRVS